MSVGLIFKSVWRNPGNRGQRFDRLARAAAWQIRKRFVAAPHVIALPNGVRFNAWPDCVTSSALMYSDWPEFWELHFIRRRLQPGEVIIDVGANVGHISLLLADVVGAENIFAFEPTPVSFRRLTANWLLNHWSTSQLYNCAVGKSAGTAIVGDPARPETKNAVGITSEDTVEVPLVSLDSFRERWRGRRVGLLVVDVEGYEPEVFAGAEKLLGLDRPRLVMFESLDGSLATNIAALFDRVRFTVFQLSEHGEPDFEHLSAQNLFAVPNETVGSR